MHMVSAPALTSRVRARLISATVRFLLVILAALAAASAALAGGGPEGPSLGYGAQVREARPVLFCKAFEARPAAQRACLVKQLLRLVETTNDPATELPRIDRYARSTGSLLAVCHGIMHSVGIQFAAARKLSLGDLNTVLPRSNDPGCSAGFAHGMIIYLGPQLRQAGSKAALVACGKPSTRYQRYSCVHGLGHAYMRLSGERLAVGLKTCSALGPRNGPDCAQGAFHDYWIALGDRPSRRLPWGADSATQVAYQLCSHYDYVRGCWYRALLEDHPRPIRSAADLRALCRGMRGIHHHGCIIGGSAASSSNPFSQVRLCSALPGPDAADCVHGLRPAIGPLADQISLITECKSFVASARAGCYRWLGKTLNVVTNGRFLKSGCGKLESGAADCRRGAASYAGPLVTFS